MKIIWQKYKVWLLIWFFYAAYYAIKSLIKLKSIDFHPARRAVAIKSNPT